MSSPPRRRVRGRTRAGVAIILLLLLLVSGAAAARQATPALMPGAVGEITAAPSAGPQALAANASPPTDGAPGTDAGRPSGSATAPPGSALTAGAINLQLLPARLSRVVKSGFVASISSDRKLSAFVDVLIPREAAKRAHIKAGGDPFAVAGTGTIPGITAGHSRFRMRLTKQVGRQLARLGSVTLTLRLTVIDDSGSKAVAAVAQRY